MRRVTKYSLTYVIVIALAAAAVGAAGGWAGGRAALEKEWSAGAKPLTEEHVASLRKDDPDPVPNAGVQVLPALPYTRARSMMADLTKDDTVKVRIAAVGNGDDGAELHVDVENGAKCTLTKVAGVAHGYDSQGSSAKMNRHDEHFVAFSVADQKIEPGEHSVVAQKLRYPETASLAIARVDAYECADGTHWERAQ